MKTKDQMFLEKAYEQIYLNQRLQVLLEDFNIGNEVKVKTIDVNKRILKLGKIKDGFPPRPDEFYSPEEFYTKHPEIDKSKIEKAIGDFYARMEAFYSTTAKRKIPSLVSPSNLLTPEAAEAEKKNLLRFFTPDELEKYAKETDQFRKARMLKQGWAKRVDQTKMKQLLKVHWTKISNIKSFLDKKIKNTQELSAVMYKTADELPNLPSWGNAGETVGIILDGWTTIAGGMDLSSDNYKKTSDGVRPDQKYTMMPDRVDFDLENMNLTKDTLKDSWNEAIVDNWKIVGFVIPDGTPQETVDFLKSTKLQIIDKRTKE